MDRERAQGNLRHIGELAIPVITIEDVIVAKLYAYSRNPLRPYDLDDIENIMKNDRKLDMEYFIACMSEYALVIPDRVKDLFDYRVLRISRKNKKKR